MITIVSLETVIIGFLVGIIVYMISKIKKTEKKAERFPYVLKDSNNQSVVMDADQILFELFRKNIILMKYNSDEHQKMYDDEPYYQYKHPSGIIYTYPTFDANHPITIWENSNLINCDTKVQWEPWTKSVYDLAKEAYLENHKQMITIRKKTNEE